MKHYLILLFCGLSLAGKAQNVTVVNESEEPDSIIQLLKNYLVNEKAIIASHKSVLTVRGYTLGTNPVSIEFNGFHSGNWIFRQLNSPIQFDVIDSITGLSYNGIVLETQVIVNKVSFYNFINPDLSRNSIEKRYNEIIRIHYPKYALDSSNVSFVKDNRGNYTGEFRLEYKTLTRQGCVVTDHYSIIPENTYSTLEEAYNCEAVIVFYHGASSEFNDKRFYGEQFEMYDRFNNLIHKGVFSRYNGQY